MATETTTTRPVAYEVRVIDGTTLARSASWEDAVADLDIYDNDDRRCELVEVQLVPGKGWVRAHAWGWTY